jgi:hypothetical protein
LPIALAAMRWGWKQWVGVVLIVFLIGIWKTMRREQALQSAEPVILARTMREPLGELAGVPLGDTFLRVQAKVVRQLLADDVTAAHGVSTRSSYAASGRHKVAVTEATIDGRQRLTVIAGPVANELVTVVCGIDFGNTVPLMTGPCAEAIRSTFGGGLIYY